MVVARGTAAGAGLIARPTAAIVLFATTTETAAGATTTTFARAHVVLAAVVRPAGVVAGRVAITTKHAAVATLTQRTVGADGIAIAARFASAARAATAPGLAVAGFAAAIGPTPTVGSATTTWPIAVRAITIAIDSAEPRATSAVSTIRCSSTASSSAERS